MTQRSRKEISLLILRSAESGATKTTLMYETYLSYDALKEYLRLLVGEGLLQYLAGELKFKTTAKGLDYLSKENRASVCNHQCKKCGVVYHCGEDKCHDAFQHGPCQQCLKMLSYQSPTIISWETAARY
jgi:predicted transcriptional regulator